MTPYDFLVAGLSLASSLAALLLLAAAIGGGRK